MRSKDVDMDILPAIDLRGGRCVRLEQGDFKKEKVFDEDPVAVARRFEAEGAEWLHVVDLDGAREGRPQNLDTIDAMIRTVKISVEVGGGIRTTQAVAEMLDAGAQRVVVGTRAVREPEWLREVAEQFPGRIALGLDAREGLVAVEGWGKQTGRSAARTLKRFQDLTLAAIVYTDIARDGMMSGPNVEATAALVKAGPFPVIASGGVTTVEDIRRLKAAGAAGAIIGRALYEGKLTLKAALEAAAT
jgi:phosphoribosylformimino-5-aminoimidazole carboxamide ribotide isomerase